MMRLGPWLILIGLVLGVLLAAGLNGAEVRGRAGIATTAVATNGPPEPVTLNAGPGDAVRGRIPYERNCGSCHGTSGKGDMPLHGPLLNAYYRDDRVLNGIVRNGVGTMPATPADQLSDQQVADVIVYIRTFP